MTSSQRQNKVTTTAKRRPKASKSTVGAKGKQPVFDSQGRSAPAKCVCGTPIAQPRTGRPRLYCSTSCRQAEYRARDSKSCAGTVEYFTGAGRHEVRCHLTVGEHRRDPERPCEASVIVHQPRQAELS